MLVGSGLLVSAILVFFILYHFVASQPRKPSGGFDRVLRPDVISRPGNIRLKDRDHYYLAGATCHQLFLATEKVPLRLLRISDSLNEPEQIQIGVDIPPGKPYLQLDSPFIYVGDKSGSLLWRG